MQVLQSLQLLMNLLGGVALVGRPQLFAAMETGPVIDADADVDADAGVATAAGTRSAAVHRAAPARTFLTSVMNAPTQRCVENVMTVAIARTEILGFDRIR
ncbi:hypothetical protein [Streptosporangium sp. NPDC048865]|uniref:hypothetical protein n=1 Tax=Streptosporangium sp. NPDC048865 TaxID=3155766 RepID=UPI003423167D